MAEEMYKNTEAFNLQVYKLVMDASRSKAKSEKILKALPIIAEVVDVPIEEDPEERKRIEQDSTKFYSDSTIPEEELDYPAMKKFLGLDTKRGSITRLFSLIDNGIFDDFLYESDDEECDGEDDMVLGKIKHYFKRNAYATPITYPKRLRSHPLIKTDKNPTVISAFRRQVLVEQFHRRDIRKQRKKQVIATPVYHANMARYYLNNQTQGEAFRRKRANNTSAARKSRAKNKTAEKCLNEELRLTSLLRAEMVKRLTILNSYDAIMRIYLDSPSIDWLGYNVGQKTFRWNTYYYPKYNVAGLPMNHN